MHLHVSLRKQDGGPEICNICRPQAIFFADDTFIKGGQRMAEEIEDKFQNLIEATQKHEIIKQKIFVLGLHGMAGGGKTTLCKATVDYYCRVYNGASCLIHLPTDKVECDALVPNLKDALIRLTHAREEILKEIKHFDQAIAALQQWVKGKAFFLAIDNVWKWSEDHVKKILIAIVTRGEEHEWNKNRAIRVIITGRDKNLLEYLLNIEGVQQVITYVPTINSEEAREFIKTRMKHNADNHEAKLKAIVDGCFFNRSCNPLVLNIMAKKLERADTNAERVLKDCMHQLEGQQLPDEDEDMDEQLISVPMKVYENLNTGMQNLFMNTVILYKVCYDTYFRHFFDMSVLYRWLRMLADIEYEEDILSKLKELENYGMLRMVNETDTDELDVNVELEIIEVGKRAAMNSRCYLLSHGLNQPEDLNQVSVVLASVEFSNRFHSTFRQCSADQLKLLVVKNPFLLHNEWLKWTYKNFDWLNDMEIPLEIKLRDHIGSNLSNLRILCLSCDQTHKVKSLRSAPNLLFLHLQKCDYLREIQDINHLHKLQELHIECSSTSELDVPNLASCTNLRRLTLHGCTGIEELAQLGCPPCLQVLVLQNFINLVNLEGLESLKSIQAMHLSDCSKIEELPQVVLPELKKLLLRGCSNLRRVMTGVDDLYSHLPSLRVLDLRGSGAEFHVLELRLGGRMLSALRSLDVGRSAFTVKLEEGDRLNPNMEKLSIRVNMASEEALKASFAEQGLPKFKHLEIEVIGSAMDKYSIFDEFSSRLRL